MFDAKVQSATIYNTYMTREQKSEKDFDLLAMAQMKFQASQRDPPLNFGELIYRLEYKKYEESYKVQKERQNIEISRIIERIVRDERLMIDLRNFIYYRQVDMIEYFNFLLDELIFRYDVCQCRDEHWKTYDKEEHVNDIRAAATALFDRYTKDSLGKWTSERVDDDHDQRLSVLS